MGDSNTRIREAETVTRTRGELLTPKRVEGLDGEKLRRAEMINRLAKENIPQPAPAN